MQHIPDSHCSEYTHLSRRGFLGGAAAAAAAPALLSSTAFARGGSTTPTVVGIFLRGGLDGLSFLVPYGDGGLYSARPTLAIQPPGQPGGALDLDGFFGLNPNAAPLLTPYLANRLALIHACGMPDPTRSHFDAMRRMETATPNQPGANVFSGWLARHLQLSGPARPADLRAVSLDNIVPQVLAQAPATLPVPDPANAQYPGDPAYAAQRRAALETMYAPAIPPLGPAAALAGIGVDLMTGIDFANYAPANGAVYPASPFGDALRNTAILIKAGVGLEAVHYDYGGWDHHDQQGPENGLLAGMLADLTASLEAFYLDLSGMEDRYVLYAKSEFGRRVAQNGSLGTDHGRGGTMLVMGHRVAGGQVLGSWPGLGSGQLVDGDLAVTTDYRDVLGEVLTLGVGGTDLAAVFPNHTTSAVGALL